MTMNQLTNGQIVNVALGNSGEQNLAAAERDTLRSKFLAFAVGNRHYSTLRDLKRVEGLKNMTAMEEADVRAKFIMTESDTEYDLYIYQGRWAGGSGADRVQMW